MTHIADNEIIFNLQGLFWLQKSDRTWSSETNYYLELRYKNFRTVVQWEQ